MPKPKPLPALLTTLALLALTPLPAPALTPDEVAVIYNTKSNESQRLARYYMKARNIPDANLMPLICALNDNTTEEIYRKRIVPQFQDWLKDKPSIKCLVTTYDVPLRITSWQPGLPEQQEINFYKARQDAIIAELDEAVDTYNKLAGGAPATAPATTQATQPAAPPATAPKPRRKWQDLVPVLNAAATAAVARLDKLPAAQHNAVMLEFAKIQERVAGINGLVGGFRVREDAPNAQAGRAQIERMQTQLREAEQKAADLMKDKFNPAARRQIIAIKRTTQGLIGEARQIDDVLLFLQPPETESAFDNELALVLNDQDYTRAHWIPNPRNVETWAALKNAPKTLKTILVTRVDASTLVLAERMIDLTLKTEKEGLKGKMYLDARGITTGGYAVHDIHLRELARWMKDNSPMEVFLDDKPDMFQAKDCPDAALYCGWYSLRHYQDVCQWVPGGVGYHVASSEMITLHGRDEPGWVANLLKRGYCGTLGPTAEPFLSSFPNPAHFFPLLLSGEFTQGEVWEVTAPMLSWRTAYVGDPLYNPFKADPQVKIEALREHPILRNAFTILRGEKPAP